MTALETGLFLLPGSIAMAILSPIAGKMYDRYGIKWIGIFGAVALVGSTAAYTSLTYTSGIVLLAFIYVVRSIGVTFLTMPLTTAGLNSLPSKLHGDGTAMQNTLQAIAGAIGTAVMTTIMTTQTKLFVSKEVKNTEEGNPTSEQLSIISSDGLLHGINFAFLAATIFAIISLISMILLAISITKKNKKVVVIKSRSGRRKTSNLHS